MAFIVETDLEKYIHPDELAQIVDSDATIVPEAIKDAIEYAKEYLRNRFDVEVDFAKESPDRNRQLLKQTIAVCIFYINERIPTNVLPESREFSFERANDWFKSVQDGKRQTTLTPIDAVEKTGENIIWGSKTKNTNNFI